MRMAKSPQNKQRSGKDKNDILLEKKTARRKRHQFILGIIVLLIVDLIWVGSAELSDYIFKEINYDKPFFTTYFKTSFFIIYLTGFLFMKNWQYQLTHAVSHALPAKKLLNEINRVSQGPRNQAGLSCDTSATSTPGYITPPRFENMTDDEISLNQDGDELTEEKKVHFNDVKEVRSLAQRHAEAQILSRMSHNSVEQLRHLLLAIHNKLTLRETMKLSIYFVVLWTFATLAYQAALANTSAAVTNILSSTSGIFTLCFAACFPSSNSDKFNVSKLLSVLVSFGGIVLVCWTDPSKDKTSSINIGDFFAIAGAVLYATYLVLIRKKVGEEKQLDMPLFFGFVGLFGALIFWPGFFILHYTKVEVFELPPDTKTWLLLVLNAAIGTVVSEILWLWGCFLTSSLLATLSLGLVAPLSMAFDMVIHKIQFSNLFFVGMVPILVSFVVVSLLTHFENHDPVVDCIRWLSLKCRSRKAKVSHINQSEEESLLNHEDNVASI